jgi:hypothetical protein
MGFQREVFRANFVACKGVTSLTFRTYNVERPALWQEIDATLVIWANVREKQPSA